MDSLIQDLRYGVRTLRKSPGFTAVAVLTLALGIGANTAIFSLINALLLRELPVREPNRLVALSTITPKGQPAGLSYLMFEGIRRQQKVFSSLFAWSGGVVYNLEANGVLWLSTVTFATGDYYRTLGVMPFMGRTIMPEDEGLQGGRPNDIAVISFGCWQHRYGSDPAVIGKVVRVEGRPYSIVGVTPKEFLGLTVGSSEDVTVPLTALLPIERLRRGRSLSLDVMGRLKEDISLEQAHAQLEALWPSLQKATVSPDWNSLQQKEFLSYRLQTVSAATGAGFNFLRQRFMQPLWMLMGLVGLVLLVACVNLASLLLAQGAARQREMAVRVALGASGWRLMRQMLTESLLLSVAGALPGLLLAGWASRLLANFMWTGLVPLALDLNSDLRVLGFTAMIAVLTGILFGLTPAWRAGRADPAKLLQQYSQRLGGGVGRLGKLLVSVQVALSLISLIAAGLFVRSLQNLQSVDPGFHSQGLLVMLLNQKPGGYENFNRSVYYHELIDRLSGLPGVSSVCLSNGMVGLPRDYSKEPVSAKSGDLSTSGSIEAVYNTVSPRFFETLGIPLLAGRDFSWRDDQQAPRVAIISQDLARQLFPSSDALGQHIRVGTSPENQDLLIIGATGNISFSHRRNRTAAAVYLAYLQDRYNQPFVQVRTRGEPWAVAASLRHQIEALGREYPLFTKTFSQEFDRTLVPERLIAILSGFFGALALLLASVGLYGLMAYTVTRRTAEIGIRVALGAQPSMILWLVLRETLLLVLIGVAIGLPTALAATRLISSHLFGLAPTDPITIAMATSLLVAVAALAGFIPAKRASRVDPMIALRYE